MTDLKITEAGTAQFPMVRHAAEVGWTPLTPQEALARRGLIWHIQGSGKTFTLLTAARLILEQKDAFQSLTVLVVVDRTELEVPGVTCPLLARKSGKQTQIAPLGKRETCHEQ